MWKLMWSPNRIERMKAMEGRKRESSFRTSASVKIDADAQHWEYRIFTQSCAIQYQWRSISIKIAAVMPELGQERQPRTQSPNHFLSAQRRDCCVQILTYPLRWVSNWSILHWSWIEKQMLHLKSMRAGVRGWVSRPTCTSVQCSTICADSASIWMSLPEFLTKSVTSFAVPNKEQRETSQDDSVSLVWVAKLVPP